MEFKLEQSQVDSLNIWLVKIKKKYGNVGTLTYSFTQTGIGIGVTVKSSICNKSIDLSEYEKW